MSPISRSRLLWADLTRVVAIYLVLVVHASALPTTVSWGNLGPFISFAVAKTCVPLFVMLSGALLLGKCETNAVFWRKRLLRVLVPWLSWTAIYTMIALWSSPIVTVRHILSIFSATFSAFWFMPMIFGLYLLTPVLRKLVITISARELLFVIILWFLGLSLLPYHRHTLAFPTVADTGVVRMIVEYLGYYLLGYWLSVRRSGRHPLRMSGLAFLLGVAWTLRNVIPPSLANHGVLAADFYDYIAPGIVWTAIGLFGLLRWLGDRLQPSAWRLPGAAILIPLSQAALGIYFVHALWQKLLVSLIGRPYPLVLPMAIAGLVNGLILFLASFVVIYLLSRPPVLKHVVA
jgi:surface polysaccharide O-acyltransferase-like enzyme